jgi:5'-3' exonuclease
LSPLVFEAYRQNCSLINYCITKVRLLQRNGIKPLLVFDGQRLKMKERVEMERQKLRVEAKDKA